MNFKKLRYPNLNSITSLSYTMLRVFLMRIFQIKDYDVSYNKRGKKVYFDF